MIEVAQGNYAAKSYHDFIGFQVAKDVLARAFHDTYGMELKDQFTSLDLALGTYRRTVSAILPEAAKVAWHMNRDQIVTAHPGTTKRKFLYNIRRSEYEKEWGKEYQRPGIFARFLAFLFRIVPKIGPFKSLQIKVAYTANTDLFMNSFNKTLDMYRTLLQQESAGNLRLPNMDFDTGRPTSSRRIWSGRRNLREAIAGLGEARFRRHEPGVAGKSAGLLSGSEAGRA